MLFCFSYPYKVSLSILSNAFVTSMKPQHDCLNDSMQNDKVVFRKKDFICGVVVFL